MIQTQAKRITPKEITSLKKREVFVFGSNPMGMHVGHGATTALKQFGAEWGKRAGIQGNSYAIPTRLDCIRKIQPYVDEFIIYAQLHPDRFFYVTRIGCGGAGYQPHDIAPLFRRAIDVENIALPADFWELL